MNKPKTVSIIIEGDGGKFLGVSRKYDHNDWGFPGGKCDGDELPIDAARRELQEETGLNLIATELVDIRDYWNKTCEPPILENVWCYKVVLYDGEIESDDSLLERGEGRVKWVTPEELMKGSFGDYNKEILNKLYGIEAMEEITNEDEGSRFYLDGVRSREVQLYKLDGDGFAKIVLQNGQHMNVAVGRLKRIQEIPDLERVLDDQINLEYPDAVVKVAFEIYNAEKGETEIRWLEGDDAKQWNAWMRELCHKAEKVGMNPKWLSLKWKKATP